MKKLTALVFIGLALCLQARAQTNSEVLARVALLADSHLNSEANGEDATFAPHFETAIAQVNAANVDFALIAGDLTQNGKPDEYADFLSRIKGLRVPVWFIPGNHDVGNKFNSGKPEHVTEERVKDYEKRMGPTWFATNQAGVRIIGVDASLLGSGLDREKDQWDFLDTELAAPSRMPTILFMHYPMFLKEPDEPGGIYWNVEPVPRARLYQLLKKGGVKAVLTGHLHRPLVNRRDGILFVSSPPTSFALPKGQHGEGWTLLTIFKNGEAREEFQKLDSSNR